MDKSIWNAALVVIKELEEALSPVGLEVHRFDPDKTENIPTVEISRPEDRNGVICNVMPVNVDGLEMTFLQFYLTLTDPAPEDRLEELEQFVKGANERFMLGSLLVFRSGLSMRYSLALDPGEPLPPEHTQTAMAAFLQQAAIYAELGQAVSSGAMTAEAALAHRE